MSIKSMVMSNDIFGQVCDLLNISISEREAIIKLDVSLEVSEPVIYTAQKYAVKDED